MTAFDVFDASVYLTGISGMVWALKQAVDWLSGRHWDQTIRALKQRGGWR